MEVVGRAMNLASKVINSDVFADVFLVSTFAALSCRSLSQQSYIETMEAQKHSLLKSNKDMKKTMWDWKQQLYTDASSPESAIVPLARLKAIYGDAIIVPDNTDQAVVVSGDHDNGKSSAPPNLII